MICAGYAQANEGRKRRSSVYSAEGTLAHDVFECCLLYGLEARDFEGHKRKVDGYEFTVDHEMSRHLQPVIDHVRTIPGELYTEHRVNLDKWMPGQFGTLDLGIVHKDYIYIGDLKYGAGEAVEAVDNRQLRIYALGFWWNIARHLTDATNFIIEIHQPRAEGGGGKWEVSLEELLEFGEEVRKCAAATYKKNAPRVASPKGCRWCEAASDCKEFARMNLEMVRMTFDDLDEEEEFDIIKPMPDVNKITPEQRARILLHQRSFNIWFEKLHAGAVADAVAGKPTPHQKLVVGRRPPRDWADDEIAEELLVACLGEKAFSRKLISPSQAEGLLRPRDWKRISDRLVTQGEGKPSLVSASDRREAIPSIVAMFRELDEEFGDEEDAEPWEDPLDSF